MLKNYFIIVIATIFAGCSSDINLSEEQPVYSENIYLEFNKWVYAQMNRQYLWREDLPDSLECNYDLAPKTFFQNLLSEKDRFSYLTTNPAYSGQSAHNYGFAFQPCVDKIGNESAYVLYVQSESAKKSGLKRGDIIKFKDISHRLIAVTRMAYKDGIVENTKDCLEFTINDKTEMANSVLLDSVYHINGKAVGYLCYLEYSAIEDVIEPIKHFKEEKITELILDLRYNPGGYVKTCQYLCNCIVPQQAYGNIFQQCGYNNVLTDFYLQSTGNGRTISFYGYPASSDKEILGPDILGLQLERVYILTSRYTASAGEATIICLQPYMDVITIGERTVGKGVGSWTISDAKYNYAIQPITMRYYNAANETTPDDGIAVDYLISDGYSISKKEIGNVDEPLLHCALTLISSDEYIHMETRTRSEFQNENIMLTPIGEPSFITEFNKKQHEYEK